MDVVTITMPKEEAQKKLRAYRERLSKMKGRALASEIAQEYRSALEGYEALAEGTPLIDIEDVFQAAPCDEKGRPKFAIARADRKQVCLNWRRGETWMNFSCTADFWIPSTPTTLNVRVNMLRQSGDQTNWTVRGYSLIPMVPADIRPKFGQLQDMFVFWEVEKWADDAIRARPDRDPYLLKHVGGALYAILAEWDLTDLERSIMKGRIGN